MSRQYVKYNNRWASFSSIVDGFVSEFMTEEEIDKWREKEYGNNLDPKEKSLMNMDDALYSIRLNRTHGESVSNLMEAGIEEAAAEKLIDDLEDKYYKPIEKNGKYYCPNCDSEVSYKQEICSNDICEMELIWDK